MNRSAAVMSQRSEPHDSFDYFPTPVWATRALLHQLRVNHGCSFTHSRVWEPACGRGHMSIALSERFDEVIQTDVQADRLGAGQQHDFLFPTLPPEINARRPEWIITNPPFRLWTDFAERVIRIATEGVAMFGRIQVVESEKRFDRIWSRPGRKPWLFMPFSERVAILKGRVDDDAVSATAYCWIVWRVGYNAAFPMLDVIPPCRDKFDRDDDYSN